MHSTDTIKQLKHTVDCPKTEHKKTVDNTDHTSMVCVCTEEFSLIIYILETFIQKLIQT